MAMLCLAGHLHAQPLTIGDTFHFQAPAVYRQGQPYPFTNHHQPLLLVFINPTCGSCDRQLRFLDSLAPSLHPSLQIVAVTQYAYPDLEKKLLTPSLLQSAHLSYLIADTVLRRSFPFRLVPHVVWIDRYGRIAGITNSRAVQFSTLNDFCNNRPLHLPLKKDLLNFRPGQPFAVQPELMSFHPPLIASSLLPYTEGISSGSGRHFLYNNTMRRIYLLNVTRKKLYEYACPASSGRILDIRLKDTIAFNSSPNDYSAYRYCYELLVPATTDAATIRTLMLDDFDRLFGYRRQEEAAVINGRPAIRVILTEKP